MLPTVIVFAYLAVVLYIGIFAFRHRGAHEGAEQFFLAGRAVGPYVFLTSLFGTHMTAFAVLGSSGHAFANGIVTFGLMATAAGFVTPLFLLVAGTRIWALGRRHGFITPVQMFRDRWECSHIGTVIFAVQAALLVPYIVIGVMGGGTALGAISQGAIPYWGGCAVVAVVVMGYVFFGGMRARPSSTRCRRRCSCSSGRRRSWSSGTGWAGSARRSATCLRRRHRRRC